MLDSEEDSISRISSADLLGQEYCELILPLFAGEHVQQRLTYMEWLFTNNPACQRDVTLPIYLYRIGAEPIGQLGIIPVDIIYHGQPLVGGWCVDLFKRPKTPRRAIGPGLLRAAFQDFPVLLSLGQTIHAYNLLRKNGIHDCGRMTHYRTLLNPARTIPKLLLRKAGLQGGEQGDAQRDRPVFLGARFGATVEELDSFANCELPRADESRKACYVQRPREFLQWRYFDPPFATYIPLRIRIGDHAAVLGVLRMMQDNGWRKAKLVDLRYPVELTDRELSIALKRLRSYAAARGAEHFECKTSDRRVLATLADSRFSTRTLAEIFMCGTASGREADLTQADEWKLFSGDCDLDLVEAFFARVHR